MTCDCQDSPEDWAKKSPKWLFLLFIGGSVISAAALIYTLKLFGVAYAVFPAVFQLIPPHQQVITLFFIYIGVFWLLYRLLNQAFTTAFDVAVLAWKARRIQVRTIHFPKAHHGRTLLDLKREDEK